VATVAKFAAVGVLVSAFLLSFHDVHSLVPMRFALVVLAIFLFFSAQHEERNSIQDEQRRRQEEEEELDLASDLSALEEELSRSTPQPSGPLKRWLDRRRERRHRRERELVAEEERSLDEILARLHRHGIDSLSPEDRALLQRASARYRSRLQP
jgi:hypothetical protein